MITIKDLELYKNMYINGLSKDIDPKGISFLQATGIDKLGNEYLVAWKIINDDPKNDSPAFDYNNPSIITQI